MTKTTMAVFQQGPHTFKLVRDTSISSKPHYTAKFSTNGRSHGESADYGPWDDHKGALHTGMLILRGYAKSTGHDNLPVIPTVKKTFQNLEEGWGNNRDSTEAVKNSILHRLRVTGEDLHLIRKHGITKFMGAVHDAASFHGSGGLDEIGSSDVTAFVNSTKQSLGELKEYYNPNPKPEPYSSEWHRREWIKAVNSGDKEKQRHHMREANKALAKELPLTMNESLGMSAHDFIRRSSTEDLEKHAHDFHEKSKNPKVTPAHLTYSGRARSDRGKNIAMRDELHAEYTRRTGKKLTFTESSEDYTKIPKVSNLYEAYAKVYAQDTLGVDVESLEEEQYGILADKKTPSGIPITNKNKLGGKFKKVHDKLEETQLNEFDPVLTPLTFGAIGGGLAALTAGGVSVANYIKDRRERKRLRRPLEEMHAYGTPRWFRDKAKRDHHDEVKMYEDSAKEAENYKKTTNHSDGKNWHHKIHYNDGTIHTVKNPKPVDHFAAPIVHESVAGVLGGIAGTYAAATYAAHRAKKKREEEIDKLTNIVKVLKQPNNTKISDINKSKEIYDTMMGKPLYKLEEAIVRLPKGSRAPNDGVVNSHWNKMIAIVNPAIDRGEIDSDGYLMDPKDANEYSYHMRQVQKAHIGTRDGESRRRFPNLIFKPNKLEENWDDDRQMMRDIRRSQMSQKDIVDDEYRKADAAFKAYNELKARPSHTKKSREAMDYFSQKYMHHHHRAQVEASKLHPSTYNPYPNGPFEGENR